MAKPKVVVKKKKVVPAVSHDQILATARARAKATIAAAKAPVASAGAQTAKQQIGAAEGLAAALAPMSQRIQDIYSGAASATADLGRGYSGSVRSALEAADAATQARLAEMGLPSPGAAPTGAVGDVIYGLGGSIPSRSLTEQGAGFASAAEFMPHTARMLGQQEAATTQRSTQEKLAEIAAKYPELFQSYLDSERNWKNQQFDNYVNYLNTQGGGGASTAKPKISIRPDGTIVSIDPYTGIPTVTGQTTPSTTTPLTGPGSKNDKVRRDAIKKRNDDTVKQIQKVDAWLEKKMSAKPVQVGTRSVSDGGVTISKPIMKAPTPPTYRVAFNYMFNQLWMALGKRYGYSKAQIREMTKKILAARGLEPAKPKPVRLPLGD